MKMLLSAVTLDFCVNSSDQKDVSFPHLPSKCQSGGEGVPLFPAALKVEVVPLLSLLLLPSEL